MFEAFKEFYGKDDGETLVWRAPTLDMNPTISESTIEREIAKDPEAGRSEWRAEFRGDISNAFPRELIESCVVNGRGALPYVQGIPYLAFNDVSGGRGDNWVQAIGHHDGQRVVVDRLDVWRTPLNTSETTKEAARILKQYGIAGTEGDNYAGAWPKDEFAKPENGIAYEVCKVHKSDLYLSLIPALSSRSVELPDDDDLVTEFRRLERRRGKSGKDSIDHPNYKNVHDDRSNAVAGLVALVLRQGIGTGEFHSVRMSRLDSPDFFLNQEGAQGGSAIERAWDDGTLSRRFWD
jgi:hypothetical protein